MFPTRVSSNELISRSMPKEWVRAMLTQAKHSHFLAETLSSLPNLQRSLTYSCDITKLRPDLRSKFVQLEANLSTLDFLRSHPPHSKFECWLRSVTGIFMSNTNANTYLGMYKMHVLDKENACRILGLQFGKSAGSLLDVGAGDGTVTAELSPLFDKVLATEASQWCIYRLKEKGIPCEQLSDISKLPAGVFDIVSCLNVLDRCSHPLTLLRELKRRMKPDGRILLAVVFPFQPFVENGGLNQLKPPSERMMLDPTMSWEESVNRIEEVSLRPMGLEIERLSRVPYLCQGDMDTPYYSLDDAIFVLRACAEPAGAERP